MYPASMEKLDNIAKKQVKKLEKKSELAKTKTKDSLPAATTELTPDGVEALMSLTYDQLEVGYLPKTPHEELAIQLARSALEGTKSSINLYWQLQKEVYKANARQPNQSFKIEVKRDEILSQALDNIEATVLEGETVQAKDDIDKQE